MVRSVTGEDDTCLDPREAMAGCCCQRAREPDLK
jgi:hypothetical protein